MPKEGVSEAPS